jgi:hypothetical protein
MTSGSLRAVCRTEGMPDRGTVMRWVVDDLDGFAAKYARAKDMGIDEFVDETLEIADDGTNDWMKTERGPQLDSEHVQRSKIRIETRRWLAERMAPKRYGLKQGLDLSNTDGTLQVDEAARGARVAQLMALAAQRKDFEDLA